MTQEEKSLLLQDLCGRLPYGVIVRHADPLIDNDGNETGEFWHKRGYLCDVTTLDDMTTTIIESEGSDEEGYEHICFLERTLPYLRPMSSMTEEEKKELLQISNFISDIDDDFIYLIERALIDIVDIVNFINWLNAHHFDYRNLIERGLAIEVTEENNPYKE